ncbi:transcriptional regulator [Kibdelosporangium aridum]|uniref:Transcriptional regulator n=1 Tax=Kibdelosporangium aridum TaxID=2030 RepID=A0A428Z1W5_KIBAR|nr:helix-turn-helix domain-containing protein [Kibdelosporangium aridum]RSM79042.1 transcriptional regulator [Kibdelosporangium aridum]
MSARRYYCPVEFAVDTIGGKWAVVILAHLKEGALRYGELRRLMPDITEKMLTQRLRELEAAGLIERTVESQAPLAVSYRLADETLRPVLEALYAWGESRAAQVGTKIEPATRP